MTKSIGTLRERGQSLFELIIALAVTALVMIGIVSLTAVAVRNSTFARNETLANRNLLKASEWLRQQRDEYWTNLSDNLGYSCLGDLNWVSGCQIPGTVFSRDVTLLQISPTTIKADITVTWTDAQGLHEVSTVAQYTNWQKP